MKIKKICFTLLFLCIGCAAYSQLYLEGESFRVGLKAGPAATLLAGNAFSTPSVKYGFTAGIYYKRNLKRGFHFQTEVGPTIRGAKFKGNGKDGYTKINLLYIDAVELILKDFKKDDHTHSLAFGLQPSVLVESWVYDEIYQLSPAARGIALNGGDLFFILGYHLNKKIIGLQTHIKIGLTNINRGLNMYNVADPPLPILPPTNNSGMIRNISWETTISF